MDPAELAPRGFVSPFGSVNKPKAETWCQKHLADPQLLQLLDKIDNELAEQVCQKGCPCGGQLHRADYPRKPRGGPPWDKRLSWCCDREGCRRRRTPPSVRFLGRKVYAGFIVVLMGARIHGLSAARVQHLREMLGIDRRTLKRWRSWWREGFARSRFWKGARARFLPPLCPQRLPWSLCVAFRAWSSGGLLGLLKFLAPLTTALENPDM